MRARCNNKKQKQYQDYGGRGIDYDPRWDNFAAFLSDVGEPADRSLTLDRIDNDIGYWPGNVRWATRVTQRHNSRSPITLVTVGGRTMCLADWAKETGVTKTALYLRISRMGMTPEEAVTTPRLRIS